MGLFLQRINYMNIMIFNTKRLFGFQIILIITILLLHDFDYKVVAYLYMILT